MQKSNFTFSTMLISMLLLSTFPMQSMDPTSLCELRRTGKESEQTALQAQEYNENECPLFTFLPQEQLLAIFPYCVVKIPHYNVLNFFIQLKTVCKKFNALFSLKEIGYCCKIYSQENKDRFFESILAKMPTIDYYGYNIQRIPVLIAIYAGADANIKREGNTFLVKAISQADEQAIEILFQHKACPKTQYVCPITGKNEPSLWLAKTPKIAQLLIKNGADIHATNANYPNVLWRVIHPTHSFEIMKFYLEKGVNARQLHSSDNSCLLHYVASIYTNGNHSDTFFKKVELLLETIPGMINTLNTAGKTPLDKAQNYAEQITITFAQTTMFFEQKVIANHKSHIYQEIKNNSLEGMNEDLETITKLIALLKEKGAKTAQELAQQEMLPK